MKGIVLAGGAGTRLYPVTRGLSKQLLPIYDNPMVYYPISVLMSEGIAPAFLIDEEFPCSDPGCLTLGDDIVFGHDFADAVRAAADRASGATVFGYRARDPDRFGVVEIAPDGASVSIEEKPSRPRSDVWATGPYLFGTLEGISYGEYVVRLKDEAL
jgi:glucose-1-phosphate thymidylyltransferase